MLIRTKQNNGTKIYNLNIDSYKSMYVTDLHVNFEVGKTITKLPFESYGEAIEALDRIFETYGMSAPANKVLDLTKSREELEAELLKNEKSEEKVDVTE